MILLMCLTFVNLALSAAEGTLAIDRKALSEADSLMEKGRYDEAVKLLEEKLDLPRKKEQEKPFVKKLEAAKKLQASDEAFRAGIEHYKNGNYREALEHFLKVVPDDTKNFTEARRRICRLSFLSVRKIMEEKEAAACGTPLK